MDAVRGPGRRGQGGPGGEGPLARRGHPGVGGDGRDGTLSAKPAWPCIGRGPRRRGGGVVPLSLVAAVILHPTDGPPRGGGAAGHAARVTDALMPHQSWHEPNASPFCKEIPVAINEIN